MLESATTLLSVETLEPGDRGPAVQALQRALSRKGYAPALVDDGIFGPKTAAGVRWFKRTFVRDGWKPWLSPRAVVGREEINGILDPKTKRGKSLRVLPRSRLKKLFGDFDYTEAGGGSIQVDKNWTYRNIVKIHVPQLVGVRAGGKKFRGTFWCHRLAAQPIKDFFADVQYQGLLDRVITFDGCYVPRHMSWNRRRPLSRHSWGIALDLNAAWNGFGRTPAVQGERGCLQALVPIAKHNGFAWGGHWTNPDGMHFELVRPEEPEVLQVAAGLRHPNPTQVVPAHTMPEEFDLTVA